LPAGGNARGCDRRVGDLHWPCAAAMLEAGLMNEAGEWLARTSCAGARGFEAYRERLARFPK
jgi:hypothetical protein